VLVSHLRKPKCVTDFPAHFLGKTPKLITTAADPMNRFHWQHSFVSHYGNYTITGATSKISDPMTAPPRNVCASRAGSAPKPGKPEQSPVEKPAGLRRRLRAAHHGIHRDSFATGFQRMV
jgi:hypothetical protein